MKNITVLGAGLVGAAIVKEIAKDEDFNVTVMDISQAVLDRVKAESKVQVICADASKTEEVLKAVENADAVVNCVPGRISFQTLKTLLEAGKNVSDISAGDGLPKYDLDELAKSKGVTAVYDIGVAPGITTALAGHAVSKLDEPEDIVVYVGGMPAIREWPYQYKWVFAPEGLLVTYKAPARRIVNGEVVSRPALSDIELIDFPGIGTLEAMNLDGACSFLETKIAPNIVEKTLRYPGHTELMTILRETGFFDEEPVDVKGTKVRPLDLTLALLSPKLDLGPDEVDITLLQVNVTGKKDGKKVKYTYYMMKERDFKEKEYTSMSMTTGFPCAIMGKMIAAGEFNAKGVFPGELIGRDHPEAFKKLFDELEKRGICYEETMETLE